MEKTIIKLAVLGTLGIASPHLFAAGTLCALPAAPTGSAYINAYNDGRVIPPLAGPPTTTILARSNFGSTTQAASAGSCQITGLPNDGAAPAPGYGIIPVVSATRTIPSVTGGGTSIGQVVERVWRKPAATAPTSPTDMCIFGTRLSLASGTGFEVNDIARGGFSSSGTVNVGYFSQAFNARPIFRIGRTFTSVQHRAYRYGSAATLAEQQNNGTGYLDLPTIGGLSTLNINGVNIPISGSTAATIGGIATLQDAQVNTNWVDFTTHTRGVLGETQSSMTYVEAPCNDDNAATINANWVKAGAISLRQTAQENTTFKSIDISGYAPPGAVVP